MIWRRKDLEARLEELEALVVQQRELLEKLREENRELKEVLADAERRLHSLAKIFFPTLYAGRRPENLGDLVSLLADGLDEWRTRLAEAPRAEGGVAEASATKVEASVKVDPQRIRARLNRLDEEERRVLGAVLKGYCTVRAVSKELGLGLVKAGKLLAGLQRSGFLDVLRVKTPRDSRGFDVYFPSPHGEAAAEVLFGKPWGLLHSEELKEKKLYMDNEQLIKEAEIRLKHAGYEKVITEFQDPGECTFRFSGGSHRADLAVYAIDTSGREVKVLVECESMSNPLYQVEKMLDAYREAFGKIYVVVSSGLAKMMMVQRVCYWAWRRREPEGFAFEARVEAIDRLTRLGYMPRYVVVRPPAR